LVIDFSHSSNKEMLEPLDQVKASVERHANACGLRVRESGRSQHCRLKQEKNPLPLGRECQENFKSFSPRELPILKTREEAMEWLVK
jgi:hypothetical protein